MNTIDWTLFFNMMPFMLFGLAVFVLAMFVLAQKKPKFNKREFRKRNQWAWILAFCYCLIGCYFYVRGFGEQFLDSWGLGPKLVGKWDIIALLMGLSGGYLGKTTINFFIKRKDD